VTTAEVSAGVRLVDHRRRVAPVALHRPDETGLRYFTAGCLFHCD
jgi:hypothetical protein